MATILVVDDCDDLRAVYAACLRSRGHCVAEARDGREGLEQARRLQPDLMILDIWMPELDGFQVLEALRAEASGTRTRILMLTVLGDGDTHLEAFARGVTDFLVKGCSLGTLVARVDSLLAADALRAVADAS